jgi:parallel beta-helix repeat protein
VLFHSLILLTALASVPGGDAPPTVAVPPADAAAANAANPAPDFAAVVRGIRPRGYGHGTYALRQPAAGRTMYWVATDGNDGNAGTRAAPFRTINHAAQLVRPGDVVTIRAGNYRGSVAVRGGGTADLPVVFQAEQRGAVVLTGGAHTFAPLGWHGGMQQQGAVYVTLRGLVFRNYSTEKPTHTRERAAVGAARGWRIEDCLFDRPGYHGLDVRGDSVVVERSTFQYAHTNGLTAWAPKGQTLRHVVVRDVVLRGNNTRPDPLTGALNTRVAKFWATTGALIDNIESFDNLGPGFWFDTDNRDFVVRNSYFHGNRTASGRGLYIEVNPNSNGLIENNVMANNEREGLMLANSQGVRVLGNLMVNNHRCIFLAYADRGTGYPLGDITIEGNFCKGWTQASAIHRGGVLIRTPAALNIRADRNTYDPAASRELTFWDHTGWVRTLADMQGKLGWENNGRIAPIQWPLQ